MSAVDTLLFVGLIAALPIAPLLGFAAPIRAYRRWRGGWRIAAAVPGIMMALVVLRIAVGFAIDSTQPPIDPAQSVASHLQRH